MGRDRTRTRPARVGELPAVMNVLDGGMLDVDTGVVRDRLDDGVLAAVEGDRVVGACVVDPSGGRAHGSGKSHAHLEAVAVRPGRRGQGIGSALVEEAIERWGPLTTDFDEGPRPFYESLGFEVEPAADSPGRLRGRRG